jgi:hypothetical protein
MKGDCLRQFRYGTFKNFVASRLSDFDPSGLPVPSGQFRAFHLKIVFCRFFNLTSGFCSQFLNDEQIYKVSY